MKSKKMQKQSLRCLQASFWRRRGAISWWSLRFCSPLLSISGHRFACSRDKSCHRRYSSLWRYRHPVPRATCHRHDTTTFFYFTGRSNCTFIHNNTTVVFTMALFGLNTPPLISLCSITPHHPPPPPPDHPQNGPLPFTTPPRTNSTSSMAVLSIAAIMLLALSIASAQTTEVGDFITGLNCGGASVTLSDGRAYMTDANSFIGTPDETYINPNGELSNIPLTSVSPAELPLYNSHRVVKSRFDIAITVGVDQSVVTAAEMIVRLHFAEIYEPAQQLNYRVFDVLIDGEPILKNFDIFNASGSDPSVGVFRDIVIPTAAFFVVSFRQVRRQPILSAISVHNPVLTTTTVRSDCGVPFSRCGQVAPDSLISAL